MPAQLDIVKIALGAFLVPWWNRRTFARALAVPLGLLLALTLGWSYAREHLTPLLGWVLAIVYSVLVAVFAVTCHRLVLLDPNAVASSGVLRWSWRETRFFLWMMATWLIFAAAVLLITTLMLNVWARGAHALTQNGIAWTAFAAKLPAAYLFARLSLVLPAVAVDRKVNWKWAWRLTDQNGWRLVGLIAVLPWIISHAIGLLYRRDASLVETLVLTFVGYALLTVAVAALSLAYHELTKNGEDSKRTSRPIGIQSANGKSESLR